jgi:putative Holliday junction resolvase
VGRILSLDYGQRRIGIAISDPLGVTAQPFDTWDGLEFNQIVEKIGLLITQLGIEKIIIGLPLTMKGEKGLSVKKVEQFAKRLKRSIAIPVILWDERLTSIQAKRILHQAEEKPSRRKGKVDLVASVLLLQNYLEFQKRSVNTNRGESV